MNIYRSFEQWKNGGFLEHGAPRTEEYTAEELHLVEMGWNYGYDAGRAVEQALDKKAENARELGLSYDDEPKIGCVNHDCDQCMAVQEPVAWPCVIAEADFEQNTITLEMKCSDYKVGAGQHWLHTTPPAPQPVPVKTYHDGKPWPVAPKPWVGLTEKELYAVRGPMSPEEIARAIEAILKEKNT